MATAIYGFEQYDDTAPVEPETLLNDAVQSIEDNLPHRFAATIAEIAAMSGSLHPNGQTVVLTADNAGAKAGSVFTRAGGRWLYTSGQIANLATFISNLSANVASGPGASFFDIGDGLPKVFLDYAGGNRITAPTPLYATIAKTTLGQKLATTINAVTFQTLVDGDNSFWAASAPADITIPETGRYLLRGQLRVNSGNIETAFSFFVNGAVNPNFFASAGDRNAIAWPTARGEFEVDLNSGDVVQMRAQRFGGSDKDITPTATWVQIRKME